MCFAIQSLLLFAILFCYACDLNTSAFFHKIPTQISSDNSSVEGYNSLRSQRRFVSGQTGAIHQKMMNTMWEHEMDVDFPIIHQDTPFDPRIAQMFPDWHIGKIRTCVVSFAGTSGLIFQPMQYHYPSFAVKRQTVQCVGITGKGWGDLYFNKGHLPKRTIRRGMRIKVRVKKVRGFLSYTQLEFLRVLRYKPLPYRWEPIHRHVRALHSDFSSMSEKYQDCFVLHIGLIWPIDSKKKSRHLIEYPAHVHFHTIVSCNTLNGPKMIDLSFQFKDYKRVLAVSRGDKVHIQLWSIQGGEADLPIGVFGDESSF